MLLAARLEQAASRGVLVLVAVSSLVACSGDDADETSAGSDSATTSAAPTASGQIVFERLDPASDEADIYTVDPGGSNERELFHGPAQGPRWSPDGTEVSLFCCDDGMIAHFIDVATGELRTVPSPDPNLELFCGFSWSPDSERVTCEGFGVDDPDRNGIYSIRAADGGALTRITSIPGGDDIAGDYSPDGSRLVFVRFQDDLPVGLFVVNVDGSGLRRLTPRGMILDDSGFAGSWSPNGNTILIVARPGEADHKAIWTVDADGGPPEQLAITPTCGGPSSEPGEFGCYSPSWSPDGEQIAFTRSDGSTESIYVVNADGSGLVQVTDGEDDRPRWGTPVT